MGKIKSKLIRRTAKELVKRGIVFTDAFEKNKKILGNTLPSKKIRNQIAGLMSKTVKMEKLKELKLQEQISKRA